MAHLHVLQVYSWSAWLRTDVVLTLRNPKEAQQRVKLSVAAALALPANCLKQPHPVAVRLQCKYGFECQHVLSSYDFLVLGLQSGARASKAWVVSALPVRVQACCWCDLQVQVTGCANRGECVHTGC